MHAPWARAAAMTATLTAALLMVPLVAMQFTTEVNWGIGDFAVAGALIFSAGMGYHLAARPIQGARRKFALAAVGSCLCWALSGRSWPSACSHSSADFSRSYTSSGMFFKVNVVGMSGFRQLVTTMVPLWLFVNPQGACRSGARACRTRLRAQSLRAA